MSKLSLDRHGNISGNASVQNAHSTGNLLRNRKDNKDNSLNRLTIQQSATTLSLDVALAQSQARLRQESNDVDDKNEGHEDEDDDENKSNKSDDEVSSSQQFWVFLSDVFEHNFRA